jgi:hypothetical protein
MPARHPGPERLEPALAALAARHGEAIARVWGGAARRRFLASLAVERAVARWRAGQRLGGVAALAGAAIAPGRLLAFARRQMRRAVANQERSA